VRKSLKTKKFTHSGLLVDQAVYPLGNLSPSPLFYVSVASKALRRAVSLLFATLARAITYLTQLKGMGYLFMLAMKDLEHDPVWYFVDEAGDPSFYGAGKKIIVGQDGCSKTFSVGFLRSKDPQQIRDKLAEVRVAIAENKYLKDIPSLHKSLVGFHAKDDCPEIRFLVYEAHQKTDFRAQVVVARKKEGIFRGEHKSSQDRFYDSLVTALFKHRLHLATPMTIVFSRRGNSSRQKSLSDAVHLAAQWFKESYKNTAEVEINIETNQPVQEPVLQATDYVMWAVQRAYETGQMRYFEFLRDKIVVLPSNLDSQGLIF